jgi:hypothetical protein
MPDRSLATAAAFRELCDLLRDADANFLEGFRAVHDDLTAVEGYRWLTEVLAVALDCYLWADPQRPAFVPIVGPTRKFGGDNADALYYFAPLDPQRTYRVRGRRGDAVYLSLTVYGGPTDGRWSERVVGILNDRQLAIAPDGSFEIVLSAQAHPGNWIRLDPEAVCAVTRDYLVDPTRGRPASWHIEALEPAPPPRPSDAEVAARLRAAANFVRDLLRICPIPLDETRLNQIEEPFQQPPVSYGWVAVDAAYAMGSFHLEDDEALIIDGTSPPCAFWNMCLWNPYLQTYDYRYERVTLNGGQAAYHPDGSWTIVVAHRDPGHPNWVSTAGHRRGRIWFRWFCAAATPPRPTTRVVPLASVGRSV